MEITVFRDPPLGQEPRRLPAAEYNLARMLQARSPQGIAFVPIRSMQILAILDAEEFVFVDNQYKQLALLAWRGFRLPFGGTSMLSRPCSARPAQC